MNALLDELQEVFREVFADDGISLTNETTAVDIDGWDSLAHLNLIIAIEKRFGVKFANAEISRLKATGSNVGTLVELISRKRRS